VAMNSNLIHITMLVMAAAIAVRGWVDFKETHKKGYIALTVFWVILFIFVVIKLIMKETG
jgi:hypothetical protein